MLIQISATTPNPPIRYLGSQPHLRGYYSNRYIAGDGATVVEPGNGLNGFYYDIACSVNGDDNLVIPAFEIQSTTDGNLPTSRFTGRLFDQSGGPQEIIFGGNIGWQITTLYGGNVTYADLFRYNQAARLLNPPSSYYTQEQVVREILALAGQFDYARVGHAGITEMRDAPDLASRPKAIGANSFATTLFAGIAEIEPAPDDPLRPRAVGINSSLLVNGGALVRGIATLVSVDGLSSVDVAGVTQVTEDSPIRVFSLDDSVSGVLRAIARVIGSGFTIISDNGLDAGRVIWYLDSNI